jgi:hypothetical protein
LLYVEEDLQLCMLRRLHHPTQWTPSGYVMIPHIRSLRPLHDQPTPTTSVRAPTTSVRAPNQDVQALQQAVRVAWRAARLTLTTCCIDRREERRYNNRDHHHHDWLESSRARQFHRHRPVFYPKISTLPIFIFNTISSNHSNHSDVFT